MVSSQGMNACKHAGFKQNEGSYMFTQGQGPTSSEDHYIDFLHPV